MNAKLCAGPSSGGSARGCVRYILGYELGALAKDENATPEQRRTLFHAQIQESMTRADFGVGAVWQPSTGGGKRPSSIYAKNVTSLATADMEMDALAAIAKSHRVREPVLHFVFSVNPEESKRTSDETLIRAAEHALEKIDLGRNAQVHAVHRDTDHAHVHVSVAAVNADTLRSWERSRNYHRLSWAVREVEIEMNLPHDRGLAMVREGNDGEKRVEWASRSELLAWARERTEERLEEQARKYAMDYLAFEDPQSWATDVVVPRLREYIEEAQTRGEQLRWTDMHLIAAQSAARLGRASETGQLTVQIMERATEGHGERETGKSKLDGFGEPVAPRQQLQQQAEAEAIKIPLADLVGDLEVHDRSDLQRAYEERRSFVEDRFCEATQAEQEFIEQLRRDPGLVSREVIAGGDAVFSRSDIDRFLGARISDADMLSRVSEQVERADGSLRLLSVDTEHPLYTTVTQQTLEERVLAKATALARMRDDRFDAAGLERAIVEIEAERGVRLSDEQRRVLEGLEYRLSWVQGEAGTGKTTIMAVASRYADLTGRPIVGFTTAQAAAEQLQRQSGAFALNSTRALVREEHLGEQVLRRNAIAMLDETSMLDMRVFDKTLNLAREREAIVIGIGDAAQLPAIAAGDTHRLMCEVAKQYGHYTELHEVRRQRGELEWMRPIVRDLGRAIREGDQADVVRNVRVMAEHDVFEFSMDRASTLRAAADAYLEARAAGEAVVLNCDSRLDARHLNREIRDCLGLEGGTRFKTTQGIAEVASGDRIVFLKNNSRLGVLNGLTASIETVTLHRAAWQITAKLDDGRAVRFDPARYRHWTYGHAVTTHKAQGQSVARDLYVMTHQLSDARLAHVGWTRGETAMRVFVSREAYADANELAQSLAERTTPKADAILYRELERRYGGPNTYWAFNVRRAMSDGNAPLRQQYQRDQRAIEERRTASILKLSTKYGQLLASAGNDAERKKIERTHRAAVKRVMNANKPQTFVQWVGKRRRADMIEREGRQLNHLADTRRKQSIARAQRLSPGEHDRSAGILDAALRRQQEQTRNADRSRDTHQRGDR